MIADPARWLKKLMQLSHMSWDYKLFLVLLGLVFFAMAWIYEKFLSLRLARLIGTANEWCTGRAKRRKQYKVIQETMKGDMF
jgi:cation-transporting ATPase 13A3/4/5